MVGCYGVPSSICPSVHTLFPDNSSYSFHWITLKLGGLLDQEVSQVALHHILRVIAFFKDFFVCTLFLDNSYSFHSIVLKLGEQLDHEMVQRILFWDYSTPNVDTSYYIF